MRHIIILSALISLFYACSQKKAQPEFNLEAIAINDKAIEAMHRFELDSALTLFDQAISLDPNYYFPHSNKTAIFISRGQFAEALHESEMAVKKKPDLGEGWTLAGMLSERLGDSITAMDYYLKSIEIFDQKISDPDHSSRVTENRINRIFSLMLARQDEKAQAEIKQLNEENPNDMVIQQLTGISREEFIGIILHGDD